MKAVATCTELPENCGRNVLLQPKRNRPEWTWEPHPILDTMYRYAKKYNGKPTRKQENCGRNVLLQPKRNRPGWTWEPHPILDTMYRYAKKYNGKPSRKQAVTRRMILCIWNKGRKSHEDSFPQALANWLMIGEGTAYRGIEWCQEDTPIKKDGSRQFKEYSQEVRYTDNPIYAKCLGDWTFLDTNTPLDDIQGCDEWFRYQKDCNKNNMRIKYAKMKNNFFDGIAARKRVVETFYRLKGNEKEPLAIYKKNTNSKLPSFITKSAVEDWLNRAGKAVYGEEHVKKFQERWTCHSIRIGATALLFAETENEMIIRNRLRWDSDKWWVYVRHTPVMAKLHAKAIADVDVDNFDVDD